MRSLATPSQLRMLFLRWAALTCPGMVALGYASADYAGSDRANPWFSSLNQPAMMPAAGSFTIVWLVLYIMIGFSLALAISARGAHGRGIALGVFGLQMLLNLAWSPVFFGLHKIASALAIILALDVVVVVCFVLLARLRKTAALCLIPYIAWLLFASLLNWQFLLLNPQADGTQAIDAHYQE